MNIISLQLLSFLIFFVLAPYCALAGNTFVKVASQEQFDAAVERINGGQETQLVLRNGVYLLKEPIIAKAPLSIRGKHATITSATKLAIKDTLRSTSTYYIYKLDKRLSPFTIFFNKKGELLPVSESVIDSVKVNYVEGNIEAPSIYREGVDIKIPISRDLFRLKSRTFACAYGYFDSGWSTVSFRINKSDDSFFYCTTLSICPTRNFQYDHDYYKKPIRYVIYNAEIYENSIYYDDSNLYIPKNISEFYYLPNSDSSHTIPFITTMGDLELRDVNFVGFGGVFVRSKATNICTIKRCSFENNHGVALKIDKENGINTERAIVSGCSFEKCSVYSDFIVRLTSTFMGSPCILMHNCVLSRYPDGNVKYKNAKESVYVSGDVEIRDNVMYNTCRGHLIMDGGNIIVSGNFLYNTDSFNVHRMRNLSNDWGHAYCNHMFEETKSALDNKIHHILLENNLIYGAYAYGGDARGIFIDDGRGDVTCNNNVILNTQSFSLDSRNVTLHDASSARVRYDGNLVTSIYRLEAGAAVEGENRPTTSKNYLFTSKKSRISNVEILENDVIGDIDTSSSCDGTKIKISKDLFKILKHHPSFDYIKIFL